MKNPLTLAGIEPATFRFVAQLLNHCATAVPSYILGESKMKCYDSLLGCDTLHFLVPQQKVIYYLNNYSAILHVGQSGTLGFDS